MLTTATPAAAACLEYRFHQENPRPQGSMRLPSYKHSQPHPLQPGDKRSK